MTRDHVFQLYLVAYSHQAAVGVKAKKDHRTTKQINGKHQRKFSCSLLLGLNMAFKVVSFEDDYFLSNVTNFVEVLNGENSILRLLFQTLFFGMTFTLIFLFKIN